jgi:hypothetical protein
MRCDMKPTTLKTMWRLGALTAVVSGGALVLAAKSDGNYVVHEWGTFTSVQGTDGQLVEWRPLESSSLPQFVYNWYHPGPGRRDASGLTASKAAISTLQRMETPVIYFYSDQEQTVDVSVRFPKGVITEWYPQADRIGPSTVVPSPFVARLDGWTQKAGAKPGTTLATLFKNHADKESKAAWSHVRILANASTDSSSPQLPMDASGSHYFSARATDANYLQVAPHGSTNLASEHEKFIFYRGVGSFETPLRVTQVSNNTVELSNTGHDPLVHLFLLNVANKAGTLAYLDQLAPGKSHQLQFTPGGSSLELASLSRKLGEQMANALVAEGLYQREADAMVNTWKHSWFAEQGLRVLYVLPRAWTEETLPLKLDPQPRDVVRVMVGRAEVLLQSLEQGLSADLTDARAGDAAARDRAVAQLRNLGRFAEPALRLAATEFSPDAKKHAWELFYQAAASSTRSL